MVAAAVAAAGSAPLGNVPSRIELTEMIGGDSGGFLFFLHIRPTR